MCLIVVSSCSEVANGCNVALGSIVCMFSKGVPPGRSSWGGLTLKSKTVDSTPMLVGPPSIIASILSARSS